MKSKAISPMVAVVLLIAFTVAIGGIISLWLTGFTETTTGSVETASTNQTKCAGTYIDVISVSNDSVIITNRGSQDIVNPICFSGDGKNITALSPNSTLSPGESSSTSWVRGNNISVVCTGSCLNIGVSGECDSEQSCWK